nr:VWA domain-containing protein [Natronocella acetinitrilica]
MDLSKSTDRFVPGSFITVLDLEKKSAGLLVDLIEERGDRIALHGFDSNGRNQVNYTHFKDFQEPFGSGQQALLDARESGLSTRMGGAIRHATALLKREQEEKKILLLITDGAPSDIDIVDDEYLVEDAREAVRDALAQGVQVFCLTLDQQGDGCAHRIFGLRRYLIVDSAEALTSHLMAAVVRLVDS